MRRLSHPALVAVLLTAPLARAAETPAVPLTLDAALETARKHAPALMQSRAATRAARARVDQARSGLLPQVQAQASYGRATDNFSATGAAAAAPGAGESDFETRGSWQFGVQATQLLWDFGRTTGRRDAAAATARAQEMNESVTWQQIALEVRSAFIDAQAQQRLLTVARETLANEDRHLEQITAFIGAGTRPPIDLLQARTAHANARVALVAAENAAAVARARLDRAQGVSTPTTTPLDEALVPALPGEDAAPDVLLVEAAGASPELRAVEARLQALRETLGADDAGFWPVLDATTGLTEGGPELAGMVWNWSGSLRMTWALYQGGLTTAQVEASRAELTALEADRAALTQALRLRVEQARLGVRAGKAALSATEEALLAARERLRLAEGRYETGLGTAIELADAQLAVTNAAAQAVRADRDLAAARAELGFALGRD
ncbi:TolC family protein [Myxococcota bacterium]|nr:TolC family protein [Myxococcota bacterium]